MHFDLQLLMRKEWAAKAKRVVRLLCLCGQGQYVPTVQPSLCVPRIRSGASPHLLPVVGRERKSRDSQELYLK